MNLISSVFLTSSLILIPVFNSNPVEYVVNEPPVKNTVIEAKLRQVERLPVSTTLTSSQIEIKNKIEAVFGPEMVSIIRCESNFRQFKNDIPLLSPTSDVGVMQINRVHWARAKSLGLDIFNSVDDNIIMGKIIYDEQGVGAWVCSNRST